MNLWQDFKTNENGKLIHKWMHFFPIYEKYFTPYRNKNINFLEIGVSKGGSLQMWQRFFGPMATIVGIDIDPMCQNHSEEDIHVRIGDQSDINFLNSIENEFGQFDIVLDDGSHQMHHIFQTFNHLYPRISKNGIYMIEDLHTAYWPGYGGGIHQPNSFINISKQNIDLLNAHHINDNSIQPNFITDNTFCISFYDSVVVYERGNIPIRKAPMSGK